MYQLTNNDFVKGAITAVFAAIITTMYGVVAQSDFNVFQADWGMILSDVVQVSMTAFIAYIGKNFLTDENGKLGGVI